MERLFIDRLGNPVVVKYVENVAADVVAGIYWTKNRMPDRWYDRHNLNLEFSTPDDLRAARECVAQNPPTDKMRRNPNSPLLLLTYQPMRTMRFKKSRD
jgi:hypothetical protein